ncbi:hypothetical protein GOODEAATRI_010626 [Goodea atripinnis]|uniref:Uncharacterized protein n=1 Tax=Goodea atripinnis TaxID=208336 RepID=A0ABV0MGQ9_9TELE
MYSGTKALTFRDVSCGSMQLKFKCLNIMAAITFGGNKIFKNTIPTVKYRGDSIMCWGFYFAPEETCVLHKMDGILRKEHYVEATSQDVSQEVKWGLPNGESRTQDSGLSREIVQTGVLRLISACSKLLTGED